MNAFVTILKWPKALIDLGYSIDAGRILLQHKLIGVRVQKPMGRADFLFEEKSEKEISTLMETWINATLNPAYSIEDCWVDLMVAYISDNSEYAGSSILLQDIHPSSFPGVMEQERYKCRMKTRSSHGPAIDKLATSIILDLIDNPRQLTYLKEYSSQEHPVLLGTTSPNKTDTPIKSLFEFGREVDVILSYPETEVCLNVAIPINKDAKSPSTRKSRTFSVKVVDFAKDDLSKRLSQPAVLEWIAQVNQPGRHVSVYNRQLVKRRLRKESSLKGWLQRTKEEFIGWVAGYSVQYDDNGLIQKVVARVQIHRKHWERLGISGKDCLRAKVINLTTGKILKHIGPIDLVVRKPVQPKVKVAVDDVSDSNSFTQALKQVELRYIPNVDSVTGHSGISSKD